MFLLQRQMPHKCFKANENIFYKTLGVSGLPERACGFKRMRKKFTRKIGPIKTKFKIYFKHSLFYLAIFNSVQSLIYFQLFATPWTAALQVSLSITNSWSLLKLMSIVSVMPSGHLILCRPLLLLPPIPPSIRVLSNESTLHMRWPKFWSFSFSISPSIEHPGLISFRMDWLNLLAVQGTLKSLLQHHSSKSINSSALSFLHSLTLTSRHDRWKNHSLD